MTLDQTTTKQKAAPKGKEDYTINGMQFWTPGSSCSTFVYLKSVYFCFTF